ncbi:hypothetical protein BGP_5006 [Beggiatoa sp. PS]|nr:hypothetical protein BGP_5006 [Beggiatoa sp. PS]
MLIVNEKSINNLLFFIRWNKKGENGTGSYNGIASMSNGQWEFNNG